MRTPEQIIQEICTHQGNTLKILWSMTPEEHERFCSPEIMIAMHRARGLNCYDAIAAYYMSANRDNGRTQPSVESGDPPGDAFYGGTSD